MKNEDFRALGDQEIHSKIAELQESQLRNRFNKVLGNLEDTSVIKKNRRDIARLKTLLSERKV
jgi:large subunit ribosomal protein L29|tara:strand:- start:44 stop:232 length:189 start_codon:yes stop_codon:yes gene_type:complete